MDGMEINTSHFNNNYNETNFLFILELSFQYEEDAVYKMVGDVE